MKKVTQQKIRYQKTLYVILRLLCHRAATEVKFNELLEQYRKEILPLTCYNYHTFTEEEKASLESLSNFFCVLHALVNFADAAQKSIKEVENIIFDGNIPAFDNVNTFTKGTELGTCRLTRTATKAFEEGSRGDEKSGCQGNFRAYVREFLRQNQLRSVPLRAFRGSRVNVLFSNASAVYFLHGQMVAFLQGYGTENRLLKSVLFDLNTKEYLASVKALCLINKLVTCPLWSVL